MSAFGRSSSKSKGKSNGGGLFKFGKKDQPQSRFVEMFTDRYTMKDKAGVPATEQVAPDAEPVPQQSEPMPSADTPSDSAPKVLETGEAPLNHEPSSSGAHLHAEGVEGSEQMTDAHVEATGGSRETPLDQEPSEENAGQGSKDAEGKEMNLERSITGSSENGDGSYRRSSVIRAFASSNEAAVPKEETTAVPDNSGESNQRDGGSSRENEPQSLNTDDNLTAKNLEGTGPTTESGAVPVVKDGRIIGFEELSAQPDIKRSQSIKFSPNDGRRRSIAPLGNSVGEIDFTRLRRRSSVDNGLTRTKSNEPKTIGFDELSQAPQIQRKSSIKFATGEERRRSFAVLGPNAGEFEFNQLSRSKSRDSDGRRLSRTTSKGEPVTIGIDDLASQPFVEPSISRSNSTRRRSFAPLGSSAGEMELHLSRSRSRGSISDGRRLSLSRSRSKDPPKEVGFDDLVNQPFAKAMAVAGGTERRRSIAPLGSSVQAIDFGQLERQKSRDGGLSKRFSLKRKSSKKGKFDNDKDVPPPIVIPAPAPAATADDASDREAYATPLDLEEGRTQIFDSAIVDDESTDRERENTGAEQSSDMAENEMANSVNGQKYHGTLAGILVTPKTGTDGQVPQMNGSSTPPISGGRTNDSSASIGSGADSKADIQSKGYLTYQTPHSREWRRRWYCLSQDEIRLYMAKEDLTPTQSIRFGPDSKVELEYEGSQAEGSFAFRATQEDATDDYYIFCDSSASRQRLVEDLRAVIGKM